MGQGAGDVLPGGDLLGGLEALALGEQLLAHAVEAREEELELVARVLGGGQAHGEVSARIGRHALGEGGDGPGERAAEQHRGQGEHGGRAEHQRGDEHGHAAHERAPGQLRLGEVEPGLVERDLGEPLALQVGGHVLEDALHGSDGHGEQPLQGALGEQPHEHERHEPRGQHHGQQPAPEAGRGERGVAMPRPSVFPRDCIGQTDVKRSSGARRPGERSPRAGRPGA